MGYYESCKETVGRLGLFPINHCVFFDALREDFDCKYSEVNKYKMIRLDLSCEAKENLAKRCRRLCGSNTHIESPDVQ